MCFFTVCFNHKLSALHSQKCVQVTLSYTQPLLKVKIICYKRDERILTMLVLRAGNICSALQSTIFGTLVAREWSIIRNLDEIRFLLILSTAKPLARSSR